MWCALQGTHDIDMRFPGNIPLKNLHRTVLSLGRPAKHYPLFFPYVYFEVPTLLILILEELAACEIAINVNWV